MTSSRSTLDNPMTSHLRRRVAPQFTWATIACLVVAACAPAQEPPRVAAPWDLPAGALEANCDNDEFAALVHEDAVCWEFETEQPFELISQRILSDAIATPTEDLAQTWGGCTSQRTSHNPQVSFLSFCNWFIGPPKRSKLTTFLSARAYYTPAQLERLASREEVGTYLVAGTINLLPCESVVKVSC